MSTEPFTDELLSAIIDGEADADIVASVEADPVASARLAQMRRAVDFVATPAPEATPARRSASIAAAMAAATPAAPEITSLAAARHERTTSVSKQNESRGQWLILAAAAVALIVAIPLVLQFRGGSAADTASDATAASDDSSFGVDAAADAVDDAGDADDAMEDDGEMAEDSMDDGDAMEEENAMDEPMADDAMEDADTDDSTADGGDDSDAAAEEPATTAAGRIESASRVSNLDILEQFITVGSITPLLTADQAVEAGVAPECIDVLIAEIEQISGRAFIDEVIFDIAFLGETAETERLVVIAFLEDGMTIALDAEDCARLG